MVTQFINNPLAGLVLDPLFALFVALGYGFFTVMVLMYFAFACLPVLCLWNQRLARTQKSALYEKGAVHLAKFGMIFYILHGVLALMDYTFNGIIIKYLRPFSLEIPFLLLGLLLMFGGGIFWLVKRTPKIMHIWWYRVNFLCGVGIFVLTVGMAWVFMRRIIVLEKMNDVNIWLQSFFTGDFILFTLFCILTGLMASHVFSLTFFVMRRHKDDFGRDYYRLMLTSHARRGVFMGILTILPALALLIIIPMIPNQLQYLLDFIRQYWNIGTEGILTAFLALAFGLPLATICLYFLGCSEFPLQRKYLAFLSLVSLVIGVYAIYTKLFY